MNLFDLLATRKEALGPITPMPKPIGSIVPMGPLQHPDGCQCGQCGTHNTTIAADPWDLLKNKALPGINKSIHLYDFSGQENFVINTLREAEKNISDAIRLMPGGNDMSYLGNAFGQDTGYDKDSGRKQILIWIRQQIEDVIRQKEMNQHDDEDLWPRRLADVTKTITTLYNTNGTEMSPTVNIIKDPSDHHGEAFEV